MNDILLGLLALLVGGVFCARGFIAMRIAITMWGAFVGFVVGAGLISAITDDGVLATALGWIVGIAVSLLFAAIAYLYYEVAIMLSLGSIGFALGTGIVSAIGITWNWVAVLAGLALGVALAIWALAVDLPTVILVVLTAVGGAVAIVFGLLLLTNQIDTEQLDAGSTTGTIDLEWWWFAIWGGLTVAGMIAQSATAARLDATWRESWQATTKTTSS